MVGARDLEAACIAWQRLGFTVSPRGRHIGWGTANYCIMLEQGYIELLGIVDPSQFTNNLDRFLERREGLLGLAFASDDGAETYRRLTAAGLHPDGPKDLKRILELPEGEALPAFKLVFLPPAETPGLSAFICHHLTPEVVRRPAWLAHANGATRLAEVTVVVDRPGETVLGYAPMFGPEALWITDGAAEIETGQGRVRFVTPEGLARFYPDARPAAEPPTPWMAAMTIEVADIGHAAECLRQRGVPAAQSANRLVVLPEVATGALLEFRPC
ncbi:VOC family protein [Rhodospirillaceae bacterium SYSU D60014]|uniref:VOC family protein n=1 Tax=Virgifigura deserti TaxID=2268457 RepID=UPI0013C4F0EB